MNLRVLREMVRDGDLSLKALLYLLECRAECEWLDYKERLELETDYGIAMFARDALAMANSGGGYLVVGVQDKTWRPVGLSAELPYDGKLLRDKVRRGCGVELDLDIVHHNATCKGTDRLFAVILVRGVAPRDGRRSPRLVKTDFGHRQRYGLQRGEIYARKGDSTVKVDTPDMLDQILQSLESASAELPTPPAITRRGLSPIRIVAMAVAVFVIVVSSVYIGNQNTPAVGQPDSSTGVSWQPAPSVAASVENQTPRPGMHMWLADLPIVDSTGTWQQEAAIMGGQRFNKSLVAEPASCENSLPTHADFELGGRYQRFQARVGIRDDVPTSDPTQVESNFVVYVDGEHRYETKGLYAGDPPAPIDISVEDASHLRLEIRDYRHCRDYFVWGDPLLLIG